MQINRKLSWKDVERIIIVNKNVWTDYAKQIAVYSDVIEISLRKEHDKDQMAKILEKLFEGNFVKENDTIRLDIGEEYMQVDYYGEDEESKKKTLPLFKEVYYQNNAYKKEMFEQKLGGAQVMAFHSYKGGVGRTLSLLAFAKAWVAKKPQGSNKVLIVDSDIEAPGLTWLQNEEKEQHFSYLDLLEMIQNGKFEKHAKHIAEQIKESTIQITTEKFNMEQYFLPTYRYKEQLFDIYSKPENIVSGIRGEYIIPESLSILGKILGVDAVLVDLRAGISEYSSPYIFDPRVKKYFVTSTSSQSVYGLTLLLEQVTKGLKIGEDTLVPEIFMTMIPKTMEGNETSDIIGQITSCYYSDDVDSCTSVDNLVTELRFSEELIHLSSLKQIMKVLGNNPFYNKIEQLVVNNYQEVQDEVVSSVSYSRETVIKNIHEFAGKQITAEGNAEISILTTTSINNLKKKYRNEIPCTVIMGAKGSGKTFLYRELLRSKSWYRFCANLEKETLERDDLFFVPVFASKSATEFSLLFKECVENTNKNIDICRCDEIAWVDNENELSAYIQNEHTTQEWKKFWEKMLVKSIGKETESFKELNEQLEKSQKRIVFILDGLEETLQETTSNESQQRAISVFCQDIVREIGLRYKNIGIIIFLRKDLARDSINVNFEQFNQLYSTVELQWSRNEALRLALWLVQQAQSDFYQEDVPIEQASVEIIEKELQKLWGLKLGKSSSNEAYSSRWILAALSDFNGQLQARDIVRFLQYATDAVGKETYTDRYIMPVEIKNAVPKCSDKKITEIKQEIGALRPILEKLEQTTIEKTLPFTAQTFKLSATEEKIMQNEGYLKIEDGKYYLPEIISHSLKFKYGKGARPKVLSLIKDI